MLGGVGLEVGPGLEDVVLLEVMVGWVCWGFGLPVWEVHGLLLARLVEALLLRQLQGSR
jgi:hypothetical protein